jgi:hypothetical protein
MKTASFMTVLLLCLPQVLWSQSHLLNSFSPPKAVSIGEKTLLRVPPGEDAENIQAVLNKAISMAGEDKTVRVEFAAGAEYRIQAPAGKPVLEIKKRGEAHIPVNMEIDGMGCTFVVTSWSRFMSISQAQNIVLKNFHLTYDPKNISQAVVTSVLDEKNGLYEITIDKGHPFPNTPRFTTSDLRWAIVMKKLADGSWGMKAGCPATFGFKSKKPPEHLGERRFSIRIHTSLDHGRLRGANANDPLRQALETGDHIALLSRTNGRSCFYISRCHSLVYRDIEINHSPGAVFTDQFSERTCYVDVKVRPSEGDLFTSTADGIFTTNQRNGPWIENCLLKGIGDDAIVLKNSVGIYKSPSEDPRYPYVMGAHNDWFSVLPGDRLAVYSIRERKLLGQHRVKSVSNQRPWGDKNVALEPGLTHNPKDPDIWIYNLSNQCNGFVLRNNTIMDHRRWGVLCSGSDGSIIGNRFIRSQNTAIYLVNSDNYSENRTGAASSNVEILSNHFEGSWHAENAQPFGVIASRINGKIEITRGEDENASYGTDWNGITNISIQNNLFKEWDTTARVPAGKNSGDIVEHAVHGVSLRDVRNVKITGNTFIPAASMHKDAYAVKINDFADVTVGDNTFRSWPGGPGRAVHKTGEQECPAN